MPAQLTGVFRDLFVNKTYMRRRAGVMSLDVLVGTFVLAIIAAGVYGMLPVVRQAQLSGTQESIAVNMAARMVEHIQLLKPSDLTRSNLSSLHLIDDGDYDLPYSITHVPLDEASRYSPAQALPSGTGSIDIVTLGDGSKEVQIQISWESASGRTRTIRSGTILGAYR
ncbi:MAG TPA: hypothetical protein PKA27_13340 [Fimbriimonadaceae bacterium]|nr:hypothetical protein [Fimbriimonadaceae bacterium]